MNSQPPPLPRVVGVAGGVGSGKSEVARALAERSGGRVVNADALGHEALRDPGIRAALVGRFGAGILGERGEIDRKRLGPIIFQNKHDREYLESLTHPWIRRQMEEEVRRCHDEGIPLIAIDAPLLFEAGWDAVCHERLFVDAPFEVRLERVTRTRGWTADDLRRREAAQLPLTWKHSRADHVLTNSTTQESLGRQVDDLLHRWGLPRGPSSGDPFLASAGPSPGGAHPIPDVSPRPRGE